MINAVAHDPVSWRRLLAGLLVACMTLAAVPALAHCCADRCHDAEPPAAEADHCDCELSGVEPPVDLLPLANDSDDLLAVIETVPSPADVKPPTRIESGLSPTTPDPAPDRTTVLLI